jgi:hypothetical protein
MALGFAAMRRALVAVLVALVVALLLALVWLRTGAPPVSSTRAATTPVARLRRGAEPVVDREIVQVPGTVPVARGDDVQAALPPPAPRAKMTLDDLAPDTRAAVGRQALAHLHQLVHACESTVDRNESLGAFMILDHAGMLELDLRPIAEGAGPIQVEDRELPNEVVDCLDDALWEQDWSWVGAVIPEGTELPAVLSMRLEPVSDEPPVPPTP